MKNKRLIMASFGFFSLMLVTLGVSLSSLWKGESANSRLLEARSNAVSLATDTIDPSEYTELDSDSFGVYVTDYTATSLSRHLNVQFESKAIEAFRTSRQDVFSVIDDPNYSGDNNNPFVVDTGSKELNGYVYTATYKAKSSDTVPSLFIPNYVKYGSRFTIVNTRIASDCMSTAIQYSYTGGSVEHIYICDGIVEVDSGAFVNVPDTVTIKCLAVSKPAGWADDWTDAKNVEWGATLPSGDKGTEKTASSTGKETFGKADDYILGYKGNDKTGSDHIDAYPLTIGYQKKDASGNVSTAYTKVEQKHPTNLYDAVGSKIYGNTNAFQISLDLNAGETIVEGSFEFFNIFKAEKKTISEATAWPVSELTSLCESYSINETLFPSVDDNNYSHQLFETGSNKYLTINAIENSKADAEAKVEAYVNAVEALEDEEGNKLYALDDGYDETYGKIYKREYVSEAGEHYAIYIQVYAYESDVEHSFVSYFFIDKMVAETAEDGAVSYKLSRALPISKIAAAVRPYEWVPALSEGKFAAKSSSRYTSVVDISDIFKMEYKSASSFLGFTAVGAQTDKILTTVYGAHLPGETEKYLALIKTEDGKYTNGKKTYSEGEVEFVGTFKAPAAYVLDDSSRSKVETNVLKLVDGSLSFRYVLSDMNSSYLVVRYLKNGAEVTATSKIKSPSPVVELSDSQVLSFLVYSGDLEGVSPENILFVGVAGITVNIHIYNTVSKTVVQNTSLLKIFGTIEILPYSGSKLNYFNINVYLIIFLLALTVVYAAVAVVLFFIKKNKYKNDEFRRVKPKEYLKSSIFMYIGALLIGLGVNFIVMRFGVFGSSVPVFNPIDPFVIAFGLAAAISIGLFIRTIVILVKAENQRKEAERLNLNKDVADDGTH